MRSYLPPGWQPLAETEVEGLYSLLVGGQSERRGTRNFHLLYVGAARLARTEKLTDALAVLESHLQLLVAATSTEGLFIHAGVVGWQGQAILIPGRTFSGKSTLVAALLQAGATYYSDEYAIIDKEGRVWPYPRLLSLRDSAGNPERRCNPEELGGEVGVKPLPVGLIVIARYEAGARWQARRLSPAKAMLALMDNTVAARSQPRDTMDRLQLVATRARAIKSKRGEAADVATRILKLLA
ncbi:MAG: hypothetical protein Kow0031_05340 [Anaerolineae bacterium]